jgi:FkbM family methyltransferase
MQSKSLLNNIVRGINNRIFKTFNNPYKTVNINFFKLKYLKHLPPGKTRNHKLNFGVISYRNPQELLHGFDEIFIQELYKIKLPPDCYIIDCGANIGLSVLYLKQQFPKSHIVAFEPDDRNFELLSKNVGSFNYTDVELKKEAVWVENTMIGFTNDGSMSSRLDQNSPINPKVKASRLKDFLNKRIDFLKMDIEGAEYLVLKDINEKLMNVENLFLEYHGNFNQTNQLTEILNILNASGFRFYIKEATCVYHHPFIHTKNSDIPYDVQLNIFCFRN